MIIAYTDGACKGNPGIGGWGAVLIRENEDKQELLGSDPYTTNNRMEMQAVIAVLEETEGKIKIVTDSQLVIYCATGKWRQKKNLDLWKVMNSSLADRDVEWEWVKGHNGDVLNERADKLANLAIKKLRKEIKLCAKNM